MLLLDRYEKKVHDEVEVDIVIHHEVLNELQQKKAIDQMIYEYLKSNIK